VACKSLVFKFNAFKYIQLLLNSDSTVDPRPILTCENGQRAFGIGIFSVKRHSQNVRILHFKETLQKLIV